MGLFNQSEVNSLGAGAGWGGFGGGWGGGNYGLYGGGYGGGCGGGIGGFGLFGLIGLLGGRDGFGGHDHGRRRGGGDDCCDDNRNLAVLAAIASAKDTTVAEGRSLATAICATNDNIKDAQFALALQANQNTQSIKDQAAAIAVVVDRRFDDLAAAGVAQTAAIIAKLNQTEIDNLRDQLHGERRGRDNREIEINIQNSQNQLQAQAQAQFQQQNDMLKHWFHDFDNQINNTKQGIINLGTMVASGTQSTQATNIGK